MLKPPAFREFLKTSRRILRAIVTPNFLRYAISYKDSLHFTRNTFCSQGIQSFDFPGYTIFRFPRVYNLSISQGIQSFDFPISAVVINNNYEVLILPFTSLCQLFAMGRLGFPMRLVTPFVDVDEWINIRCRIYLHLLRHD